MGKRKHQEGKTYWSSIQWPSWKESGMGEVKTEAYKKIGIKSHTDKEGLMFLDACLNQTKEPIILPGMIDPELNQNVLMLSRIAPSKNSNHLTTTSFDKSGLQENISQSLVEKAALFVQNMLSKFLKIESSRLDRKALFQEFGVDSILLVQMIKELDKLLGGASLDPSIMLEYPTIDQLVHYIVMMYHSSLDKYFKEIATTQPLQTVESKTALNILENPIHSLKKKRRTP